MRLCSTQFSISASTSRSRQFFARRANKSFPTPARQSTQSLSIEFLDYPSKAYHSRKISVGPAEYWEVPVDANVGRVTRLAKANSRGHPKSALGQICVFHDIEESVDPAISSAECAGNLTLMLQTGQSFGLSVTYNILGTLFNRKIDQVREFNPNHSIGFHSFNHDLADLTQLPKCRQVDPRVRGYSPPQSRMTCKLSDYNLTKLNFEWLACGAKV